MYWSIDDQNSAWDHINIEGTDFINYILSLIFVLSLNYEYIVYSITI